MSDWIAGVAGTPEGARLAVVFALVSALAHALFGAIQKGRHDPWESRAAIDACWLAMGLPLALVFLPLPDAGTLLVLAGAVAIHFAFKVTVAMSYARGGFTVVYPVARGTAPLATVGLAMLALDESYGARQWAGVALLSGAIMALALLNLRRMPVGRASLAAGLAWAVASGVLVALYTVYDAWAIRRAPDPIAFLAWFFVAIALDFPLIAALRWRRLAPRPALRPLVLRGVAGALIGTVSFSSIMLAARIGQVGEAAALRETSVVFAALIGRAFLSESVGLPRFLLMVLIAAGAVLTQMA